jgi:hypothetical protein
MYLATNINYFFFVFICLFVLISFVLICVFCSRRIGDIQTVAMLTCIFTFPTNATLQPSSLTSSQSMPRLNHYFNEPLSPNLGLTSSSSTVSTSLVKTVSSPNIQNLYKPPTHPRATNKSTDNTNTQSSLLLMYKPQRIEEKPMSARTRALSGTSKQKFINMQIFMQQYINFMFCMFSRFSWYFNG